ncbi:MAG: hypothetical protein ACK42Z_09155, partial [Candidatus Kapaibacteriota bacterium]
KDRPGAVVGVVAIHAVIGYALVTGLNFTQIVERVKNPQAIDVVVPLPPPPPTPPQPDTRADEAVVDKPVVAPKPIIDVSPIEPNIDTTPVIIPTPDTTASKARKYLNWEPQILFHDLVKIMVDYDLLLVGITPKFEGYKIAKEKGFGWTEHKFLELDSVQNEV